MNSQYAKALLHFVPEHERTSCSDENVRNAYTTPGRAGYPRCTRCALLKASESESYADMLELEMVRVKLPEE